MHELAHLITKKYEHNTNYWNNFRLLLKDVKSLFKYLTSFTDFLGAEYGIYFLLLTNITYFKYVVWILS